MGLAYATSPIGGSHMRGDPAYFELFSIPEALDPQQWEGKAGPTKAFKDLSVIIDAAGLCIFFTVRNLAEKKLNVPPERVMCHEQQSTTRGLSKSSKKPLRLMDFRWPTSGESVLAGTPVAKK